jgi:hypothetical protein
MHFRKFTGNVTYWCKYQLCIILCTDIYFYVDLWMLVADQHTSINLPADTVIGIKNVQ